MFQSNNVTTAVRLALLVCCVFTISQPWTAYGQTGENIRELKQRATELMEKQKYTDALPLLEKIAVAEPEDALTHFYLGFALIAQANVTKDSAQRKAVRVRARNSFLKSKELGNQEPLVDALIKSIPPDGSDGKAASQNAEANKLMEEAEGFFSQGKMDEALKNYQKALALDPQIYEAALFSGDVYLQRGDFEKAETWYQKAIAINPNRETAYRYSATPFMKQGKYEQARDRYVEAFITEPYSNFTLSGLTQWAEATNTTLAHPAIDIPTEVTFDEKGDAKVELGARALLGDKLDGFAAWLSYGVTRSTWYKEKFAKTFPQEKKYRHSLPEETEALRTVISIATKDPKVKTLDPSIARLKKLDEEGLLEAYILLARPDRGISEDYPAYLKRDREKLRRYVLEYIFTGGGK